MWTMHGIKIPDSILSHTIIWKRRSNSWSIPFWMRMETNHHQRLFGTEVVLVLEVFRQFWRMSSLVSLHIIWWSADSNFYFQQLERFWKNGDQITNLESLSFALFEIIVRKCSQQMKRIWLDKVKMFQLVLQWLVMVVVPLTHSTSISVPMLVLVQSIQHFIKSFTMTMISSLIML